MELLSDISDRLPEIPDILADLLDIGFTLLHVPGNRKRSGGRIGNLPQHRTISLSTERARHGSPPARLVPASSGSRFQSSAAQSPSGPAPLWLAVRPSPRSSG